MRRGRVTAPVRAATVVSLIGALLAVWATWRLARAVAPASMSYAVAAASVVAFNPQFLFMAVTVTNDAWAAGTVAMTVALAAEAALGEPRARGLPVAGCGSACGAGWRR